VHENLPSLNICTETVVADRVWVELIECAWSSVTITQHRVCVNIGSAVADIWGGGSMGDPCRLSMTALS